GVGLEAVEGVRPDLRLDPGGAQRLERLVAPIELHDVRLPAVPVALVRGREVDQTGESLGIRVGEPLARLEELLAAAELRAPDRAQDVREPVVEPRGRDLEVAVRLDSVVAHAANRVGDPGVVRRDSAALAGRDDLARMKRETAEPAEPSARPPAPAGAESSGRVLEQLDVRGKRGSERVPVERPTEEVDGEDGARP